MAIYIYSCKNHGNQEIVQGMNDKHVAKCPKCGLWMQRIFTTFSPRIGHAKMGNTRQELFDNLAAEGIAPKNWKDTDPYFNRDMNKG